MNRDKGIVEGGSVSDGDAVKETVSDKMSPVVFKLW